MNKSKASKHVVILVNYLDAKSTLAAISSIEQAQDAPHIIVVDNGSPSQSLLPLQAHRPKLDLILAGQNLGFAAANNLGIKQALQLGAQVVYLLNNDTLVDPNLFTRAYRFVVDQPVIAGAKIYYAQGHEYHPDQRGKGNVLWYAGGYFDSSLGISRHYGIDESDQGQYDATKEVDFITGCFMAIPRQVLIKIGLLAEPYFLYLEDTEYCLRALAANIKLIYNPHLVLHHLNGASTQAASSLVDYYLTRNRFYLAKQHGSYRLRLALFREAIFRNFSNSIRRAALLDYLVGRMGNQNVHIQQLQARLKP